MQLDQRFRQCQADTQPGFLAIELGLYLREHREDLRHILRREADAIVDDADEHVAAIALRHARGCGPKVACTSRHW